MAEAKLVVKNKFWVVEEDGHQIGTIQAVSDGVVLVQGPNREKFPSLKILANKHNIKFTRPSKQVSDTTTVYGFVSDSTPYNPIYDVKLKLPLYTKEPKSKSYYCAGFYLVDCEGTWLTVFCPKKIVLNRAKFFGPFATRQELVQHLKQITS